MPFPASRAAIGVLFLSLVACGHDWPAVTPEAPEPRTVRVAQFNVREMSAEKIEHTDATTGLGADPQLLAAAQIILRVSPDVLVLQEIDLPETEPLDRLARRFVELYLAPLDQHLAYPYVFVGPTNTGVLTALDLDGDGHVATAADRGTRAHGNDSYGFGTYPGQYSMAVLSRLPIVAEEARTFQQFRWHDLPGNHLPENYYSDEAFAALRLSSKSHWDVPVEWAPGQRLHVWVSHPTPPGFDGSDDHNGRRNFDEIRFWALYADGEPALVDDRRQTGGYAAGEPFVVVGDLNASPDATESLYDGRTAISQLLEHERFRDPASRAGFCSSRGAPDAGTADGPPRAALDRATAGFRGGMRIDYVLPSSGIDVLACAVFWPAATEDAEGARLADDASDHRLVWADLALEP